MDTERRLRQVEKRLNKNDDPRGNCRFLIHGLDDELESPEVNPRPDRGTELKKDKPYVNTNDT